MNATHFEYLDSIINEANLLKVTLEQIQDGDEIAGDDSDLDGLVDKLELQKIDDALNRLSTILEARTFVAKSIPIVLNTRT